VFQGRLAVFASVVSAATKGKKFRTRFQLDRPAPEPKKNIFIFLVADFDGKLVVRVARLADASLRGREDMVAMIANSESEGSVIRWREHNQLFRSLYEDMLDTRR